MSLFHGWRMDSYVTVLECLGCVLTELWSTPTSLPRIYPLDVCALLVLFCFAVTLLRRYGTWIPNSILASVQLGAAVSSGVPQTGLLPVGSRGRLSSGIPRRRPYSTLVCGRIMLRVVFLATTVSITGRYWLNSGLWLRRLPRPHHDC